MEAAVIENWTIEESHPVAAAMAKAGEDYAQMKRDEEQMEVDTGPPHIHKWISMVEAMIDQATKATDPSENVKGALQVLQQHLADLGKMQVAEVAELISMCKVKGRNDRPGRNKEVRILFNVNTIPTGRSSVPEVNIVKAVRVMLAAAHGNRSSGPVPPSLLETTVGNWVSERTGKSKGKGKDKDRM